MRERLEELSRMMTNIIGISQHAESWEFGLHFYGSTTTRSYGFVSIPKIRTRFGSGGIQNHRHPDFALSRSKLHESFERNARAVFGWEDSGHVPKLAIPNDLPTTASKQMEKP
jgi:hypothetical protein